MRSYISRAVPAAVLARMPAMMPTKCITPNGLFLDPLAEILSTLRGALGGLLFGIVVVFMLIAAIMAVFTLFRDRGKTYLSLLAILPLIPIALIIMIALYTGMVAVVNEKAKC